MDKELLKRFANNLLDSWSKRNSNRLLRVGGWLYLFIPEKMQKEAEMHILFGNENATHLHVAGLTFHTDKQFKLFYQAFCQKGDNRNSEWYRSLRNILRFRDNALSKDVLTDDQINKILDSIVSILERNSKYILQIVYFNNCIEAFVYLLKRRRYDNSFLAAGTYMTIKLNRIFDIIKEKHPIEKYRKFAAVTIKFLNKEATDDDVGKVLESGGNES